MRNPVSFEGDRISRMGPNQIRRIFAKAGQCGDEHESPKGPSGEESSEEPDWTWVREGLCQDPGQRGRLFSFAEGGGADIASGLQGARPGLRAQAAGSRKCGDAREPGRASGRRAGGGARGAGGLALGARGSEVPSGPRASATARNPPARPAPETKEGARAPGGRTPAWRRPGPAPRAGAAVSERGGSRRRRGPARMSPCLRPLPSAGRAPRCLRGGPGFPSWPRAASALPGFGVCDM